MQEIFEQLFDEAKPCENPDGCDSQATVMIWCDHHFEGCDYTGFRCQIHLNLLVAETIRQLKWAERKERAGNRVICGKCKQTVRIGILSEHLRWVTL